MNDPAATDTGADATREAGSDHGAGARRRVALRILLVGGLVSLLTALVSGAFGVPGALAGAVFLSLLSLTSGVAGATLAVGVVVDQFRGRHVALSSILVAGVLLLTTLVLLVASAGAVVAALERAP